MSDPSLEPLRTMRHFNACHDDPIVFTTVDSLVAGSFASAFSILGTFLNACAIIALLNFSKTRYHVTTPFIVSLATSDFMFSAITLPILATKFFSR